MTNPLIFARQRMLREHLQGRGIRAPAVLDALARVPREQFVELPEQADAYADTALPIDCQQTISQPYIVALMTEALELAPDSRVLEIGTGSGYQTAILAELAGEVYSIERHAALSEQARERLQALGYTNVQLRVGDGARGWFEAAPFDRIILTAATERCPPTLWEQLVEGGLLVAPLGPASEQVLYAQQKTAGKPHSRYLSGCRFVPLISD